MTGATNVDIWERNLAFAPMEILASQFRAARALLDETQEVVAAWAKLDRQAVGHWETGRYKLFSSTAEKLQQVYEVNGVEFVPSSETRGAGVRWRQPGREDKHRGAQLRAARAMADVSLRQLKKFGVGRSFLWKIERGKTLALNLQTVGRLEAALLGFGVELTPESEAWGAGVRWIAPTEIKPLPSAKTGEGSEK